MGDRNLRPSFFEGNTTIKPIDDLAIQQIRAESSMGYLNLLTKLMPILLFVRKKKVGREEIKPVFISP